MGCPKGQPRLPAGRRQLWRVRRYNRAPTSDTHPGFYRSGLAMQACPSRTGEQCTIKQREAGHA
jgi:hypothetical protein